MAIRIVATKGFTQARLETPNDALFYAVEHNNDGQFMVGMMLEGSDAHVRFDDGGPVEFAKWDYWYMNEDDFREAAEFFTMLADEMARRGREAS